MSVYLYRDEDGDVHELGRTHPPTSEEAPCVTLHVTEIAAEAEVWFDALAAGRPPKVE